MKLDVILRTCKKSTLENNLKDKSPQYHRICGDDREKMIFRCIKSLIKSISKSEHDIKLTVLDDNSDVNFLIKLDKLLSSCSKSVDLIQLDESGFNNSAYQQFKLASECKDLVYTVEDDYLHEEDAIDNMIVAYNYFFSVFKLGTVIFPFDCPFRYESGKEEHTLLLHDGTRYWRQVKHTSYTILTHSSIFKKHLDVFSKLALEYPKVNEEHTINKLYKSVISNEGELCVFNPIPSVAYHLSYQEPVSIKTTHLNWKNLWDNYE